MSAFNDIHANFLGSPLPWDLLPIPENLLFSEDAINFRHEQQVSLYHMKNDWLRIHEKTDDKKKDKNSWLPLDTIFAESSNNFFCSDWNSTRSNIQVQQIS